MTLRSNRRDEGFTFAEKESGYQGVRTGDLVIHAMDAFAGAIGVSDSDGKSSPVYAVCKPRADEVDVRYVAYCLRVMARTGYIASLAKGIRERSTDFRWSQAGEVVIPLPSLLEQRRIAAFLDHETTRIDELVREQERLIALINEKRKTTVTQLVQRGMDRDVPTKETGVPWIGKIPRHWSLMPLKHDLHFVTSGSRGWAAHYADEGALFLRIGNLTRTHLDLDLSEVQRVVVPAGTEGERTRVQPGDVLFSITAYLGSVAVAPSDLEPAYVSQHVALARVRGEQLLPTWIGFVTLSSIGEAYLAAQGYGGTKIQLSLDDVREMVLPVPPLSEQHRIVKHLQDDLDQLDRTMTTASQAITLLRERRFALIAAAVTGQLDLRQWDPDRPVEVLA